MTNAPRSPFRLAALRWADHTLAAASTNRRSAEEAYDRATDGVAEGKYDLADLRAVSAALLDAIDFEQLAKSLLKLALADTDDVAFALAAATTPRSRNLVAELQNIYASL